MLLNVVHYNNNNNLVLLNVVHYTALGSDGQGPQGSSFVFLDLFDFFDLFADLARACLGFLERPSRSCEVVRVWIAQSDSGLIRRETSWARPDLAADSGCRRVRRARGRI